MESKIEKMLEKLYNWEYLDYGNFYESKQEFLIDFKNYLSNHSDKVKELKLLEDIVLYGDNSSKIANLFYIDCPFPNGIPNYVMELQEIIISYKNNKESTLRKFRNVYTIEKFEYRMDKFEKRFINSELFMEILYEIKNNLEFKNQSKAKKQYVNISMGTMNIDENILKDIYESDMSLLDYAFYNRIDYTLFNKFISTITNPITKDIRNRKDTVEEKIIDIIKKINSGEMDFLDYYKECKLEPKHLKLFVSKYHLYGKSISNFIAKNTTNYRINIETELSSLLVINNEVVPKEVKEQAIKIIKDVDAPLIACNYSSMVRKLMKERTQ